jgi:hypothetical protein
MERLTQFYGYTGTEFINLTTYPTLKNESIKESGKTATKPVREPVFLELGKLWV